ncbi:cation diffusion facilitator family transporter [Daejeonella sp.]|uniref:cation diffusion facilitator family transporter n=1 Tax=Daejeonella sp. TaxID=2805397 RepID=UPI0027B8DD5F|nr:cation diffusion facilitator family transporter [Daejeonella sp.]
MQTQKKVILLSLIVGVLLMLAKFTAYLITSSNSILTDAAESIVNILASLFAFYSIYVAAQPKDLNHPYGHGKVEFFSVFIEGTLIIIAGILISFKSVYNLFYPHQISELIIGTLIIGISGLINYALGYYLIDQSKKHNSLTLNADGKHLQTDAYTSVGLVIGLMLIHFTGLNYLDSILSISIGIFIIYSGYKLVRKSVSGLMDESDFDTSDEIIAILNTHRKDSWIDMHNLRTQRYGPDIHIDCHLTLPYYFDLNKVHEEVSEVDKLVNFKANSRTEFFIHADPCMPECCHYCRMLECSVRSEPKNMDIAWTIENVTKNQKHFTRDV